MERFENLCREFVDLQGIGAVGQQYREFVAAEAREKGRAFHCGGKRSATAVRSWSPIECPQAVVDMLEAVQIEQQQRAGHGRNVGRKVCMQGIAVGERRHRIEVGKVLELLLSRNPILDVAKQRAEHGLARFRPHGKR